MKIKIILLLIILLASILRIFSLGSIPNSLYTDETDQGYNAYSILKTGRDEHGIFLPISLRSFGDWKPPLPTYLMIPFITFLDLNEYAVRLPSALLGILTIILIYKLIRVLYPNQPYGYKVALLASFLLSISPWHILQSRSAMLVIVALFFLLNGIYYFLKGLNKSGFFIISLISLSLSIYSYYGLRLVTPLLFLFLIFFYRKSLKFSSKGFLFGIIFGFIILFPLGITFFKQTDTIFGRAKTVSIFYDKGIKLRQWELITQDGVAASPVITRFYHNNLYMFGRDIVRRFASHFDGRYLFMQGDTANPFRIPSMGIFYLIEVIFLLLGAFQLYRGDQKPKYILLFWLIVAVLPSSLSFITPASNRSFNAIIPLVVLISLGISSILGRIILASIVSIAYILSFGYFLNNYFIRLPLDHADWWSYELKETAKYVIKEENNFDRVIFLNNHVMSYIYLLFYSSYDPQKFQNEAVRTYVADPSGFEHVESFGKYIFYNDLKWQDIKDNHLSNSLYVVSVDQAKDEKGYNKLIMYPNGNPAYKIFKYD